MKDQVQTKGLISKRKFIRYGPLLVTGAFIFETGAVLGRAMRTKLEAFSYAFAGADPDGTRVAEHMRERGREIAQLGGDADSLQDLILTTEMRERTPGTSAEDLAEWMMVMGNREVDPDDAMALAIMFGLRGAGYGSEFPELFERLYVASYKDKDPEEWNRWVRAGLDISPEPPEFVPLDERTETDLIMFAEYCSDFYPEYVEKLGLQRFVGRIPPT